MAKCKYCGKSAGVFSHVHKICEDKHVQGIKLLEGALRSYFRSSIQVSEMKKTISFVSQDNFISSEDIAISSDRCISEWTNIIHWPFHPSQLNMVKDFLSNIGVSYQAINKNGALDRLCQKMLRGFMAEYFTGQKSLQRSLQISQQIMCTLPITQEQEKNAYYEMLGQAGKNYLKKGNMTSSEQQKIDEYVSTLGLSLINLPESLNGSYIEEIGQSSVLNDIKSGRTPRYTINAPIILAKDESALWCYNHVTMYQEKIRREYVGRSSGYSFRLMKGVTYRTGGFKGHPVETSYMENMGIGSLYITNKNIIFKGQTRSLRVPYTKIIGINPYSDGMEVQRDGSNAKRLVFQGFDCSFVLNVINVLY